MGTWPKCASFWFCCTFWDNASLEMGIMAWKFFLALWAS
jgi:hypothetical protein